MRWFPTKMDAWLLAILILLPAGVAVATAYAFVVGQGALVSLASLGMVVVLYAGLIFPMRYGIGEGQLLIRHGLVTQRCRLAEIRSVKPTRSPLSSPALSLDRLEVRKGDGFFDAVMISPADKAGFLAALMAADPGLVRDGDGLKRA